MPPLMERGNREALPYDEGHFREAAFSRERCVGLIDEGLYRGLSQWAGRKVMPSFCRVYEFLRLAVELSCFDKSNLTTSLLFLLP